ncbi:hypothetical protein [Streptomyces bauhiniae]
MRDAPQDVGFPASEAELGQAVGGCPGALRQALEPAEFTACARVDKRRVGAVLMGHE